jgi:hypothetical protein
VQDGGRRPPTPIKDEPPPQDNPSRSLLFLPRDFLLVSETLSLASFEDAGTDVPELRHVALKLRHGFLLLLVKPIETGSSQSTPTNSVYRRRVTIDLLLLTISGLADELYSSGMSS